MTNLTVKMTNPSKLNPVSGKPVSYKFIPTASQLMLAHPDSVMAKRGEFCSPRENVLNSLGLFLLTVLNSGTIFSKSHAKYILSCSSIRTTSCLGNEIQRWRALGRRRIYEPIPKGDWWSSGCYSKKRECGKRGCSRVEHLWTHS